MRQYTCKGGDGMPEKCKRSISTLTKLLGVDSTKAYEMLKVYSIMTDLSTSDPIILDMILEDNNVDTY